MPIHEIKQSTFPGVSSGTVDMLGSTHQADRLFCVAYFARGLAASATWNADYMKLNSVKVSGGPWTDEDLILSGVGTDKAKWHSGNPDNLYFELWYLPDPAGQAIPSPLVDLVWNNATKTALVCVFSVSAINLTNPNTPYVLAYSAMLPWPSSCSGLEDLIEGPETRAQSTASQRIHFCMQTTPSPVGPTTNNIETYSSLTDNYCINNTHDHFDTALFHGTGLIRAADDGASGHGIAIGGALQISGAAGASSARWPNMYNFTTPGSVSTKTALVHVELVVPGGTTFGSDNDIVAPAPPTLTFVPLAPSVPFSIVPDTTDIELVPVNPTVVSAKVVVAATTPTIQMRAGGGPLQEYDIRPTVVMATPIIPQGPVPDLSGRGVPDINFKAIAATATLGPAPTNITAQAPGTPPDNTLVFTPVAPTAVVIHVEVAASTPVLDFNLVGLDATALRSMSIVAPVGGSPQNFIWLRPRQSIVVTANTLTATAPAPTANTIRFIPVAVNTPFPIGTPIVVDLDETPLIYFDPIDDEPIVLIPGNDITVGAIAEMEFDVSATEIEPVRAKLITTTTTPVVNFKTAAGKPALAPTVVTPKIEAVSASAIFDFNVDPGIAPFVDVEGIVQIDDEVTLDFSPQAPVAIVGRVLVSPAIPRKITFVPQAPVEPTPPPPTVRIVPHTTLRFRAIQPPHPNEIPDTNVQPYPVVLNFIPKAPTVVKGPLVISLSENFIPILRFNVFDVTIRKTDIGVLLGAPINVGFPTGVAGGPQPNTNRNYPFIDDATMTSISDIFIPPTLFEDARVYPPGGAAIQFISRIVVAENYTQFDLSDNEGVLAVATVSASGTPYQAVFVDVYNREVGILIGSMVHLRTLVKVGTELTFRDSALQFVPSVTIPQPQNTVQGFVDENGNFISGEVWIIGEDGVQLRYESGEIVVHITGDPLFRRSVCNDESATPIFNAPIPLDRLRIVGEGAANTVRPDDTGNIQFIIDPISSLMRLDPIESGFKLFLARK